jgi:hypothetical protein
MIARWCGSLASFLVSITTNLIVISTTFFVLAVPPPYEKHDAPEKRSTRHQNASDDDRKAEATHACTRENRER